MRRRPPIWMPLCLAAVTAAHAQEPPEAPDQAYVMDEVIIRGRADSLLGVADAASQGTVGAEQLERRPILRTGELLETVPGFIATQHSSSGKANQYFLRGFNLDHGTDFATHVDGVPINMPTHGHGQGYTDLNFLIPELVDRIDFKKGPYYAEEGDFASAGSANFILKDRLDAGFVKLESGLYARETPRAIPHLRAVTAGSPALGGGTLLYALDAQRSDGPWEHPDDFRRFAALLRYSGGDRRMGWSVTGTAYTGEWDSSDQIARRAVRQDLIERFDSLDRTTGGDSQRYGLYGEWHRLAKGMRTEALLYTHYYDLNLYSNFTYFLDDPADGDQFKQEDRRQVTGLKASHTFLYDAPEDVPMETAFGVQIRNDVIENGLFKTSRRRKLAATRQDEVVETSVGLYAEQRVRPTTWLRLTAGVRGDLYDFKVNDKLGAGDAGKTRLIASPKGSLVLGPWMETELYLSGGFGFHSNDARGVGVKDDPATPDLERPVRPLVRTKGAEVGLRTLWIPGLQSTLAFWMLDIDSELVFVGDAGNTEASRPSRRMGVEFANYYSPTDWLTLDADLSVSRARFRDSAPEGDHIPGAIETVVAAGASVHDLAGFFGELRLRYFGPRPLVEDDSQRSGETIMLNARIGYEVAEWGEIAFEAFNLLNRKDSDIEYFYPSLLAGEPPGPDDGGYNDIHFHPVEPLAFRLALTARF